VVASRSGTNLRRYDFRRLYGLWLVGFKEIPSRDAFPLIASGVRASFSPITRVGVLCLARSRSCATSLGFQGAPLFFGFVMSSSFPAFESDTVVVSAPKTHRHAHR
jgi:hypothetical protein